MKFPKLSLLLAVFLPAATSFAEAYKIEVCKIALSKVVDEQYRDDVAQFAPSAIHVFVKTSSPSQIETFNFEPIPGNNILSGSKARIGKQAHSSAECAIVWDRDDQELFIDLHNMIADEFSVLVATTPYRLNSMIAPNSTGMNCQEASKAVIENIGLVYPEGFENSNRQLLNDVCNQQ